METPLSSCPQRAPDSAPPVGAAVRLSTCPESRSRRTTERDSNPQHPNGFIPVATSRPLGETAEIPVDGDRVTSIRQRPSRKRVVGPEDPLRLLNQATTPWPSSRH